MVSVRSIVTERWAAQDRWLHNLFTVIFIITPGLLQDIRLL